MPKRDNKTRKTVPDACPHCPPECFANTFDIRCAQYMGRSMADLLDLDQLLADAGSDSTSTQAPVSQSQTNLSQITSDNVMSKSVIKNSTSICGAKISDRNLNYKLSSSRTTATFGWNLLSLVSNLPDGYELGVARIRVTGNSLSGDNSITDSSALSSGVSIGIDQFPVTADFSIRITSPCGDIDLEKSVKLFSPTNTGDFNATLTASDLNPLSGEIMLTDQLNNIESQIYDLDLKLNEIPNSTLDLQEQNLRIDQLIGSFSDPSSIEIDYSNNGANQTASLNAIVSTLFAEIKRLQSLIASQQIQINSNNSRIDSI